MAPNYKSLEDGQIVKSDEPREDLEALARWVRTDEEPPAEPDPIVPSSPSAAGPVNKDAVNGGEPPVGSVTAGVAPPAEELSPEEAAAKAAADLGAAGASTAVQRPALNGTTEEWAAFAKSRNVELPDDAGRDQIVAAYIDANAPAGNATKDAWASYASDHGVQIAEDAGRDKIREAVIEAGWARA